MTSAVEAARSYLAAGWAVVPVEPDTKSPKISDWPMLAAERAWSADDFEGYNVGVVLGSVSGDLVDIDLDSQAAVALAPHFLPSTLTFGRASKRASHWLFLAQGVRSAMHFFWTPFTNEHGRPVRELVEIRSTNASSDVCGHQSVFPGSTHESGEAVEWDAASASGEGADEPTSIDGADLCWRIARLTVASAILNTYGEGSGRNAQTLGYAGGLLKSGWTVDEVRELFDAVRAASGDDRAKDKDAVERVIAAYENGTDVQGFGSLINEGAVSETIVKSVERHAMTPEARLRAVRLASTGAGAGARQRMLADARAVDGIASAADLVAVFGKAEQVAHDQANRSDAPGVGAHAFEARGTVADLEAEPPPLSYLWGPFAPGKVSAISSFANGGKSPFAELLALHTCLGRDLFGMSVRRARAAYLDFEGGRLSVIRLRRLARGLGLESPPPELKFLHCSDAIDEKWCEDLHSYIESAQLGLVVIDTYGAAMTADIDHNAAAFAHWLKQLGHMSHALDVVIVVLLHEKKREQGKRKGSDLEMISGHNAAPGALQGVVSLYRPVDEDKTLIAVHCARAPEDSFATFNIRWEDCPDSKAVKSAAGYVAGGAKWGLRAVVVEASQADETRAQVQLAILEHLQTHRPEGDPIGKTELVAAMRRNQTLVSDTIDAMVSAGVLVGNYDPRNVGRGKTKTVWLPGKKNSAIG